MLPGGRGLPAGTIVVVRRGIVVATLAAGLAAMALVLTAGGDDSEPGTSSPTSSVPEGTSATAAPTTETSAASGTETSATTTSTSRPGVSAAPWRAAPVPRSEVPGAFFEAWSSARNRATCGLLVPTRLGPEFDGAQAKTSPVNDNAGWNIRYRKAGAIVEVLGLFERSDEPEDQRPAAFSRTWADGSVARYGPDDPGGAVGGNLDPEASANEAVLLVTGQGCAYRIYDTLGKSHLEMVFDGLRFVEGTE